MTTYCILDGNNNVLTTFANSQAPTTMQGYSELPVTGGEVGNQWNGVGFVAGPAPVPQSVTPLQAKTALLNAGIFTTVNNYMNTTATPADLIAWQSASQFNRTDPMISNLMAPLGLTSPQLDALFIAAAAISV